ncbi:MAG: DUF2461 domain-containing protein [Ruminococcus sp.]|nr:DUF2461 domain-containing protein [Candidatus Copronaster equi]
MSYQYDGIFPETLALMAQNRFENSKLFYEEHKQQLKDGFTVPLRQIAAALSEQMLEVDDTIVTDPVRMVSRIRRDTRFTKDKSLYRDHLWIMFMRNKHEWKTYPCIWMGVNQDCWDYGVGTYFIDTRYQECFRQELLKRPYEFLDAVKQVEKTGAQMYGDFFKKPKPGNPIPEVEMYYNMKHFGFIKTRLDFKTLESDSVITQLGEDYRSFEALYKFLKSVADERTKL